MSYRLLEFRMGTDCAQAYALLGEGEHEGTSVSISFKQMNDLIITGSLLGREQAALFLAEQLDRMFLRAHADRIAAQFAKSIPSENPPAGQETVSPHANTQETGSKDPPTSPARA